MVVRTGFSTELDSIKAVEEVFSGITRAHLIIFLAPVSRFKEVHKLIVEKFPSTTIIGSSTSYVYSSNGVSVDSITAAIFEDGVEVSGGVIREINRYPMKYAGVVKTAAENVPLNNTICLEFTSALSMSEELVVATLNSVCEEINVPVVGGSAGLSLKEFKEGCKGFVSYNENVYTDECVFVFIHNNAGRIKIYKEIAFTPTSNWFKTTKVDIKNRVVCELDGQNAAKVLANAFHCTQEELPSHLADYPIGRVVGKDVYISDFNHVLPNGSVAWNTRIYNGIKFSILKPSDLPVTTNTTIEGILDEFPKPSFTFMIHCVGRTFLYEKENFLKDFASAYANKLSPVMGFSSTGEQLFDTHLNQTLLVIIFE